MAATPLLSYRFTSISIRVPIRLSLPPKRISFSSSSPPWSPRTFFSPPRSLLSNSASLFRDAGATAAAMAGGYALVSAFDSLTQSNLIQQSLSRKLVHILSGLLFMASWPLFSTSIEARYFASVVPLANCIRLLIHGLSLATDEALIKSVTRDGNPEELLRGPLYYVLVLIFCALVFWRESPVGVISLAMMCGGDGVADIIGRRFGFAKLPYNQHKSWAGSISMFAFGFLVSLGMLYYFSYLGYFALDWTWTVKRVALVSLMAAIVESLPISKAKCSNTGFSIAHCRAQMKLKALDTVTRSSSFKSDPRFPEPSAKSLLICISLQSPCFGFDEELVGWHISHFT